MTQEQIDLVLRRIAEIAGGDESKTITFQQIRQKTGVDGNELEYILTYLGKEGYIKDDYRVFDDITPIYITHLGASKYLSFNTQEQINLVLRIIAEIADGDESKAIIFQQIREKTGLDDNELENILIYLGKEGYIKDDYRVFDDITPIYITHLGIQKSLSFN
jgi:DNA-binding IscR family transcriptional regulator